jgi:hypothetical protein
MAIESTSGATFDAHLTADADLSTHQYKFVKLSSTGIALCAAATDIPYGILQNAPKAGLPAQVQCSGISKLKMAAATVRTSLIGTNNAGLGAIYVNGTDTTSYIVGQCIEATGAASGIGSIAFTCLNPNRGA